MLDRQDEALGRFLRRFPAWCATLRQGPRFLVVGFILSIVMLMCWLEIRDALQFIGLLN
jgi:hypothetical protein